MRTLVRRLFRGAAIAAACLGLNALSADGHYEQWRLWAIAFWFVVLTAHLTAILVALIIAHTIRVTVERDPDARS